MKKFLFLSILAVAFACGDGSRSGEKNNEAGASEENADTNSGETVSPDTTNTDMMNDSDSTDMESNQ